MPMLSGQTMALCSGDRAVRSPTYVDETSLLVRQLHRPLDLVLVIAAVAKRALRHGEARLSALTEAM